MRTVTPCLLTRLARHLTVHYRAPLRILTYTPAANFTGSDSFTFKVNDGTVDSTTATITINVTNVNDAPVALGQSVTTAEETAKTITLSGTDADSDTLSFNSVSTPSNGTLSGTAPNLTYTPAANFTGSDSFTFKVNDGTVDSKQRRQSRST